jgi:hypothetical protein
MKPRAAIFLSGRVHGWQHCIKDFETAFSFYDYDIYCSLNCKECDPDYLEFSKYKPVKKIQAVLTSEYLDFSKFDMNDSHSRVNSVSMFLHNKLAFNLIEEEYDIYIRARNDFCSSSIKGVRIANSQIPLFSKEELNTLWIPSCHKYGIYNYQMNDQFAISNYENMKKYCSLIDSYNEIKHSFPKDSSPETLLAIHIEREKIRLDEFVFDYFLSNKRHVDFETHVEKEMWGFLINFVNDTGIKIE